MITIGIYNALEKSGAITDMIKRNIEHLHVYGIDNILTKSLDPNFLGICIKNKVELGNKVVWRNNKNEKVGVTVSINNNMHILEYSEIPSNLSDAMDETGKLIYGAANICNHYITVDFLINKIIPTISNNYHLVYKKIPYLDPSTNGRIIPSVNNGIKLEMFIFDVFPIASKWIVMEVNRKYEFAPIKNEPGNVLDSPTTAMKMLSEECKEWLTFCGGILINNNNKRDCNDLNNNELLCEISPLLSYAGEGLECYKGVTIELPCYLE